VSVRLSVLSWRIPKLTHEHQKWPAYTFRPVCRSIVYAIMTSTLIKSIESDIERRDNNEFDSNNVRIAYGRRFYVRTVMRRWFRVAERERKRDQQDRYVSVDSETYDWFYLWSVCGGSARRAVSVVSRMVERSGVNWWRSDVADIDTAGDQLASSPVVRLISPRPPARPAARQALHVRRKWWMQPDTTPLI